MGNGDSIGTAAPGCVRFRAHGAPRLLPGRALQGFFRRRQVMIEKKLEPHSTHASQCGPEAGVSR